MSVHVSVPQGGPSALYNLHDPFPDDNINVLLTSIPWVSVSQLRYKLQMYMKYV